MCGMVLKDDNSQKHLCYFATKSNDASNLYNHLKLYHENAKEIPVAQPLKHPVEL